MKKLTKEIIGKTPAELLKEVTTLRHDLAKFQIEAKIKPEKDSNLIQKKHKRLAVVLTVMKQRELGIIK